MRALFTLALLATVPIACGGDDAPPPDATVDAMPQPDVDLSDAPPACHTCMDILMGEGDPPLCAGSLDLFNALNACTCTGACMDECGGNICMGMAPEAACTSCLQDMAAGCGNEYAACAMDS
jgi:hypothetical protein